VGTAEEDVVEASCANTEPKQSKEDKTEKVRGIVMDVFLPLLTAICSLFMLMAYCRSYPAAPFALILSDSILLNTHLRSAGKSAVTR